MRLTTVLLIASLIQVSAASFGQRVSIDMKNAQLKEVFKHIHDQSGYDFIYEVKNIPIAKVNVSLKEATVEQVLALVLAGQPITYEINNKDITIKLKEVSILDRVKSAFTAVDVNGQVVDSTGTPLQGASVKLKSGLKGVYTNSQGRFVLSNAQPGDVIVITYVGYNTREIIITSENASDVRIVMAAEVNKLTEVNVVSTGYQTLSKERSAGSFTKVDMDVVSNRTTSMNVLQSLDGQVPGLVVNNVPNRSQILIRGLSTTGGTTGVGTTSQPLYVVDGLAMPKIDANDQLPDMILGINPQDIESITVLKDATAASIWGARASNGVIVIKTKSGKLNSKLRVNYSGFVNFQGKPDLDYNNVLSPQQFVETGTEIFNTPGYSSQYPYATVSGYNGGGITPLELLLYNPKGRSAAQQAFSLDSLSGMDNRGQINDLFYRNALLSNHTASISGGGDKYAFYASTSYTNVMNSTPGDKNENIKINLRQDLRINKNLSFHVISDISNNNSSEKRNLEIGENNTVDYFFTPYQMFRDGNGSNLSIPFMTNMSNEILQDAQARSRISLNYNPLDEFNYGSTKSDGLLARINGGVKLKIINGLTFDGTYGYIKGKNKLREIDSQQSYAVRREVVTFAVAASPTVVPKYYLPATGSRMTTTNGDQHKWDIRNQLTYDNTFGKHEITVLAGQEAQEQFNTFLRTRIRGFDETLLTPGVADYVAIASLIQGTILPNLSTIGSSMINDTFSTNETTSRFTSYYSNFAYTFDRRYAFNASWRIDQSNLFGKDKSAQNKPIWSAGAKWNVSNEAFMKPVKWVQNLALRLTYGLTGNSPEVGVAASRDITRPSGSPFFPGSIGMLIVTPGNPKLSWESTKTINAGLDFSVLSNRLSASVDVYQKKTTDLLGLVYPNSLTGFPAGIVGNQGDITNKGIEVGLSSINVRSNDFNWSTTWNFAHNKSMVDKITVATIVTTGAQQVVANVQEGYPAYTVFAYKYGGVDNTGAPQAVLADGTLTKANLGTKPADIVYMGTMQPVWNGGLSNNFRYKDFGLSANMVYNMGHVMRRPRYLTYGGQFRRNVSVDFLNRWRQPGDETSTNIPGYITNANPNAVAGTYNADYFIMGDVNVVSASFVKLRDITLFYDLPTILVNKIKAQGVTFRAQLSNVMLWKANKYGIDPEFQGVIAPSNQNTITVGANVSF
ncbi:SusC/RagA family TonB-linked outer membrane protein [Pedobacter psychroterrae]|nr:SusC/RagA family TonB-linked outer membrane protein [Pedobacter psychroterrae]